MSVIMVAYNYTGSPISRSTTTCNNKLECLRRMCITKQLPGFNNMIIYPFPGSWSNKCNLTATNSIKDLTLDWYVKFLVIIVANIISLFIIFIIWLMRKRNSSNWYMMTPFVLSLYLLSLINIMMLAAEVIDISSQIDNVISGGNYYRKIHNIILLTSYLFIYYLQ